MKIKKSYIFLVVSFIMFLLNTNPLIKAEDSETTYEYSYTYNNVTYYSNESEDDAWYKAMLDNFEKGLLTEEQIENEYANFSRRNINVVCDTYDNQSDLTGEPKTYVNGYLTWTTSTNYVLPLKNIRVDLYNENLIGSEYLATTYTNNNGYYQFEFINDESLFENGYDVFIRCYPDSYTFEIARDWLFSFLTYYYIETETKPDIETGTTTNLNIHVLYSEDNMRNCSFYLSQGFVTAQRFMMSMGVKTDKFLHVIYPFSDGKIAFSYDEYSGIAKKYFNDFDTIMHEYGHFVEGVLGNYGSTLMDIILNNPSHFVDTDHFFDKPNKKFAMQLTWSEAWATVFAEIAQQYYLNEYRGKVSGYGDLKFDNISLENYYPTADSCEAQEMAVIASLWDIFDDSTDEPFDNLAFKYGKWWDITTRENTQTLSDFFSTVNTYFYEYRSQIGEIFGAHQISPSNFELVNPNSVSETISPQFSWTVNGSINNPNNNFKLVLYDFSGNMVYETNLLSSELQYTQTFIYTIPREAWVDVLSNFVNIAEFNVVVQAFNSDMPKSGPYNSKQVSIRIEFQNHSCNYSYRYVSYDSKKHKSLCSCGDFKLELHTTRSTSTGRYKPCVSCGYLVDTGNDFIIVGPTSINNNLIEINNYYISKNTINDFDDNNKNKILVNELIFNYDYFKKNKKGDKLNE